METKANYVLIGFFTLGVLAAAFGFVHWFRSIGKSTTSASYHVVFQGPVGGLRTGEIPGTGHLERILFNEKMEELRRESLLVELRQRIRDVKQGPDGLLYVLTDQTQGAILRIEPAN